MQEEKLKNYLRDVIFTLKENSINSKKEKDMAYNYEDYKYELGRLMAYHEVISILQQQAEIFNIPLDEILLSDINPETHIV